ncbi:MAG: RcpC/CpaB family pilus assembly protein [Acidimicrobiia bacterium]
MARNRSTALIAVGAAVFVVGAALTFLLVRDDGGPGDGKVTAAAPQGGVATAPAAPAGSAAAPTVAVPSGKEGVAVQVPAIAGLAGYAGVGDRVNVYGTFKDRQPNSAAQGVPAAKLIIADAQVLAVTGPPAGAEGGNATYLLAVEPGAAEQVVYLAAFEGIWLSLTPEGAPRLPATPGRTVQNIA